MKIGDEVYIHGCIDEIRGKTVIIRNKGGYFGTVKSEIKTAPYESDIVSYPTDKYFAVIGCDRIQILKKDCNRIEITWEGANE